MQQPKLLGIFLEKGYCPYQLCIFLWVVSGLLTGCGLLNQKASLRTTEPSEETRPTEKVGGPAAGETAATPKGMVLIPAGQFQMGSEGPDADSDENPVHAVHVDAFYIDKHEVTNAVYQRFVLANPKWQKAQIPKTLHDGNYLLHWEGNSYPEGKAEHPVVYVSWYAAMAYAEWTGKRLPTEAEWEKAARGGLIQKKYPWGDRIKPRGTNYEKSVGDTTPIGSYAPNGYGLYDMAGNVWEWCLDAYDARFYFSAPSENPIGGVDTSADVNMLFSNFVDIRSARVLRGGSWWHSRLYLRAASRNWESPTSTYYFLGFRCVKPPTP